MKRRVSSRRRVVLGATGLTCAALVLTASASAVTIGSTHVGAPFAYNLYCGGNPSCSLAQTRLPGAAIVKAPSNGHITQWKVSVLTPGKLRLLVLEKVAPGQFKALAQSGQRSPGATGVRKFETNLGVKKGNFIALSLRDANVSIGALANDGARQQGFLPAFTVGDTLDSHPGYSTPGQELQFNATLEG
jgi:hypothetical protein